MHTSAAESATADIGLDVTHQLIILSVLLSTFILSAGHRKQEAAMLNSKLVQHRTAHLGQHPRLCKKGGVTLHIQGPILVLHDSSPEPAMSTHELFISWSSGCNQKMSLCSAAGVTLCTSYDDDSIESMIRSAQQRRRD